MISAHWDPKLVAGLKALAEASFPKRCANCGAVYQDVLDYAQRTAPISETRSGLKQTSDDDGRAIVEMFRNCACGSTLMDAFGDRRDLSEAGAKRRQRFSELITYLVGTGLDGVVARTELLTVMHGGTSEILARLKPPKKT
jgi:hypothetical protein